MPNTFNNIQVISVSMQADALRQQTPSEAQIQDIICLTVNQQGHNSLREKFLALLSYPEVMIGIDSEVITVSADKSAKVWDIKEDGGGDLSRTLTYHTSGGVEDMLVTSANDFDKVPITLSGHMKNVTSLSVLKGGPKMILSTNYDGLIIKWIQGSGGYRGRKAPKLSVWRWYENDSGSHVIS